MAKPLDMDDLAARILHGELGDLSQAELDAVLAWISGSEKAGAAELIRHVGAPRERPDVMRRVYAQLDGRLFFRGELDLRRAGVQPGIDEKLRRGRFRRLMAAFHPDRHPDDADWLTPRSRAVLEAYHRFRSGDGPAADSAATAPGSPRASQKKPSRYPAPRDRNSARLTPQAPGLVTRLRIHLRRVDNLPGKILAGLAVLALVPVISVYLAYKPYRDRMAPEPSPLETATLHSPQPDPAPQVPGRATRHPDQADAGLAALAAAEVSLGADELPGEIDTHRTASAPSQPARDSDGDPPLLDLAGKSVAMLMSWTDPEQAESMVRDDASAAGSDAEPAEAEPEPRADEPSEPARSAPDPNTDEEPRTAVPEPRPRAEEPPAATEHSVSPTETRVPEPEAQAEEPSAPTRPSEGATDVTQPRPQAAEPSATAEPAEHQPADRIEHLFDTWSLQFAAGNLDGLMGLLSDNPRENANRGRRWFRESYGEAIRASMQRRINIEVLDIERRGDAWRVQARFDLRLHYADADSVDLDERATYTIVEDDRQRLRIHAIEY